MNLRVKHAKLFDEGTTMKLQKDERKLEGKSSLQEARRLLNRWQRRAIVLGTALFVSVASVIPFLDGHSLHEYADRIGKYLIYLSMCLLPLFVFCAAQTYNFWIYLRDLKKEYKRGSA